MEIDQVGFGKPAHKLPTLNYKTIQPKLSMSASFDEHVMIGEGTYGKVYKCKLSKSNEVKTQGHYCWTDNYRAVKRIKYHQDKDGFPITALREIQVLRQLNHDNIVRLEEILTERMQM